MDIESLRKFCQKLKGTTEDIKWEHDLCFCIAGKMYCVTGFEKPLKISLKADAEEFETLIQTQGIIPAPYLARNKWVLIEDVSKVKRKDLERLIEHSYELIKGKLPKKDIEANGAVMVSVKTHGRGCLYRKTGCIGTLVYLHIGTLHWHISKSAH